MHSFRADAITWWRALPMPFIRAISNCESSRCACFAKHTAYISRREVKVFRAKIFLYEWALTAKIMAGNRLSKMKIIYFSK
jgi:hypothetical protein